MDTRVRSGEAKEDKFTGAIEKQTSRLPSSTFLGLAVGAFAASALMKLWGRDTGKWSSFVATLGPAFLIMGLYNKTVKQHGSDAVSGAKASWESLTSSEESRPTM